jgi:1,4-alpha-glucan branching enzyme
MTKLPADAYAVVEGRHTDPFRYLGLHLEHDQPVVRAFLPHASHVDVLDASGNVAPLIKIHADGLFAGPVAAASKPYKLRATYSDNVVELYDPYEFSPILTDYDLHLLGEGKHQRLYEKLGAHMMVHDVVHGVAFVVFAPDAKRVSVVGDFYFWNTRRHAMRVRGMGDWEIFIPGVSVRDRYKFDITGPGGRHLLKADPLAFATEMRPATASVVVAELPSPSPLPVSRQINRLSAPISIYEVHLGSWRRKNGHEWLTYRELAETLPRYARDLGFTHLEFLPVSEHPFDGSWGYQPTGLFAPTSRFGRPEDFAALIAACHREGLGVLLDWVPGHFPDDPHGLVTFDGTALYEHSNPQQGRHPDWGTLIYNYGRTEVANFLVSNALFWLERYGVDGLRVDAVASMLYLDYSRSHDEWVPNRYGGRENLEAIQFIRRFNTEIFGKFPNATTAAEESTAWPQVSRPIEYGGLGFGYKWNMGWMHDTLNYISKDPIYRKHHHGEILFGLHYAFSENFILPLSHDEVVHGKRSILGRMPGDAWQRFANLRVYYSFMFGHPGKKLLFMGCEFAQEREWNHDQSIDWHLLDQPAHSGIQKLVRDLNHLYRAFPALHELDCDASGFEWLITDDANHNMFAWLRKGTAPDERCVVVVNFSPNVYHNYRVRVPLPGTWREVFNSDSSHYGGTNVGNTGLCKSSDGPQPQLSLTIPPLAAIFLVPDR